MPAERFQSGTTAFGDLEIVPSDQPGLWTASITQEGGLFKMVVTLDWSDFQRLGLFVNRETRRHALALRKPRGA